MFDGRGGVGPRAPTTAVGFCGLRLSDVVAGCRSDVVAVVAAAMALCQPGALQGLRAGAE
ncbi:hypothetical protein GCM10009601_07110 [Streptomyces thermospinosisporus]|uniref:Uncharacterized protein n=1 Tax=Streptomyces thermospinosisporus TaxID=161482 RepID=A0ABN1YLZ9_9ACTN